MKILRKIYLDVSDKIFQVLGEDKRLLCFLLLCNLTYLGNDFIALGSAGEITANQVTMFLLVNVLLLSEIFIMLVILRGLPKIFTYVIVALTVVFFCVDSVTIALFKSVFDKGMFQVLLDTNIQEATEFVGNYSSLILPKLIYAIPLAALLVLLFKAGTRLVEVILAHDKKILRLCVVIGVLGSLVLSAVMLLSVNFLLKKNPMSVIRFAVMIPRAVNEIREYRKVYENLDTAEIKITRNESDLPWVIFILGESTGRNHMSLYGYNLPTTPNLSRRAAQNDLIVFTDCISGARETMPVCQRLFTFYDNRPETDKPWYCYANIFDILKAAGYHTAWLSNQEVTGIYGNVPRAYADRCNEKKFTSIHDTETSVYEFDEKILPLLDDSLKKNSSTKNFYVLHLLGTHLDYNARYPAEFEIFTKDDEQGDDLRKTFKAAYDNAVLYNDFIVEQIIRRFEDKDALIIYVSDHGENVFDDGIHLGHGPLGNDRWQVEIPMIFWLSDACKKNHPELVPKISAAKDLPFMTDDMIHALLDLMKIHTEDFDSRKSLFSEDFDSTRRRIYAGEEYVNGKFFPAGG